MCQFIVESCASPSYNLISLSYSMPDFSANLFGLFNRILDKCKLLLILIMMMQHRVENNVVLKSPSLTSWAPPPTTQLATTTIYCSLCWKSFWKKAADWFLKRVSQLIRLLESGKNVGNTRWLKPMNVTFGFQFWGDYYIICIYHFFSSLVHTFPVHLLF